MGFLSTVVNWLLGLGSSLLVMIVLIILGLIFRVGWQKAVRGGITTGVGLAGLFLVVNLIISALQPAVAEMATRFGISKTFVDVNWADAGIAWGWPGVAGLIVTLLIVNILFLILGALVDVNVSQLVFVPLVIPLMNYFHIDPVHFGVMICLNMMIGLLTPPFGMLLFITAGIGKISLKDMIRETMPLVAVELVALGIITYIPQTVLFLTRLMK